MPGTFFGPYSAKDDNFANSGNANLGRFPLGHTLILPDAREYKFTLNDGTVEIAGNLYQSVASVTNHIDRTADVVRAVGATVISATLGATIAAIDIYAEGVVHTSNDDGEGYTYRTKRAFTAGEAHALAASSAVLTVNLDADESVQVALTTGSEVTFTRNRYHQVGLHGSPPTSTISGVSPGVAAADRFFWSQTKGYAAVLAQGTMLEGNSVMPSITTNGAVENRKRQVRSTGTTVRVLTSHYAHTLEDQDGTATAFYVFTTATVTAAFDITSGIADNAPVIGMCVQPNSTAQQALIDLNII